MGRKTDLAKKIAYTHPGHNKSLMFARAANSKSSAALKRKRGTPKEIHHDERYMQAWFSKPEISPS